MKIYISADMEGLAGVCKWSDVDKSSRQYPKFQKELISEVSLICKTLLEEGATVTVKDAHWTGKNISSDSLPKGVKLISGWSGNPYSMMEYLNGKYDGVIFVGYHGPAGSLVNPLGHFVATKAKRVKLNGKDLSEFRINTYIAAQEGVPVLCVLGDKDVCSEAKGLIKNVVVLETLTKKGCSLGNKDFAEQIKRSIIKSLRTKVKMPKLPKAYELEVEYNNPRDFYKASKRRGVYKKEERSTISFKTTKLNKLLIAISSIL